MVGIHLEKLPDAGAIGIVPDGAIGAVGDAFRFSSLCLGGVDGLLRGLVEDTDIQQARLLASAQDILEDAFFLFDVEAFVEFPDFCGDGRRIIGLGLISSSHT